MKQETNIPQRAGDSAELACNKPDKVKRFLQAGAREILRGLAFDILAGAKVWPDAQKIEKRFKLTGFTIRLVCWLEDRSKAVKAIRCLARQRFELDEIDRIQISCAQDELRDFERGWGRMELASLKRAMNFNH